VEKAIVVRGRLVGRQRIDLDTPVSDVTGEVEVVVRAAPALGETPKRDVFQVIASLSAAGRSKLEIDRQLAQERAGWPDR
jgi:hypothetical protein